MEAIDVVGRIEGIAFVHFNERDVVRHNLVQQIIKAYDEFGTAQGQGPTPFGAGNRTGHNGPAIVPDRAPERLPELVPERTKLGVVNPLAPDSAPDTPGAPK